jgi:hypothetical protein
MSVTPTAGSLSRRRAVMAAKLVSIKQKGSQFHATVDGGSSFYVGSKVVYKDKKSGVESWGLMNLTSAGDSYDPSAHTATHGFWADFVYPICQCESRGSFQCLNTYDRASFTFGFLQYAAHVPNGDFVRFFRALLAEPLGPEYFPDLALESNRIVRQTDSGAMPLESDSTTEPLMDYLNPSLDAVEEIEVINAAKFVHWSITDEDHRAVQVQMGIDHIKAAMVKHAAKYALHQALDKVCLVITDIRHQGRAKSFQIIEALDTDGDQDAAYSNLLQLGLPWYESRIKTLKKTIAQLVAEQRLGTLTYDTSVGDFVPL